MMVCDFRVAVRRRHGCGSEWSPHTRHDRLTHITPSRTPDTHSLAITDTPRHILKHTGAHINLPIRNHTHSRSYAITLTAGRFSSTLPLHRDTWASNVPQQMSVSHIHFHTCTQIHTHSLTNTCTLTLALTHALRPYPRLQ